jgi:hypothetical protein
MGCVSMAAANVLVVRTESLAPLSCARGVLWDVSTLCALVPPPKLYGVVGTGVLWDVSTLCAQDLLLDYMGWWATVYFWMSVHCVL